MTETEIVNLALDQIGVPPITSLDDSTENAKKCKRAYATIRQAVLRDHTWNFAIASATLAADATAASPNFTYSYTRAALDIRVLSINDDINAEWKVEGRHIVTDEAAVVAQYVQDVTDPTLWDALFTAAFPIRLASHLSLSISHNAAYAKELLGLYTAMIAEARGVDGQEGTLEPYQTTTLTTDVRGS